MEGVCGTISKNRLRQVGFHFSEDLLEVMGNHVPLLSENYGYNNLFCLYRLQIDEDAKTIQQPSRQLVNFNDKDNAQKVVIQSPDLKLYLAMDIKYPELPPHYKMEQALMAQEGTYIF